MEYYRQGNFTQAISDFNKAIEINPNDAEAYNNLSVLYAIKGDLSIAMSDFNKAIEINPKICDAYKNRALIYYQLKKYDQSWKDVLRAEKLGENVNPQLVNSLRQIIGK